MRVVSEAVASSSARASRAHPPRVAAIDRVESSSFEPS
jgi:hypothetical protein